jgi:hypothetical protein
MIVHTFSFDLWLQQHAFPTLLGHRWIRIQLNIRDPLKLCKLSAFVQLCSKSSNVLRIRDPRCGNGYRLGEERSI